MNLCFLVLLLLLLLLLSKLNIYLIFPISLTSPSLFSVCRALNSVGLRGHWRANHAHGKIDVQTKDARGDPLHFRARLWEMNDAVIAEFRLANVSENKELCKGDRACMSV